MNSLAAMGIKPFGGAFERTGRLSDIRAGYEEHKSVKVAGRLTTIRKMGKSMFADLNDGSDRFQLYVAVDVLGAESYKAFTLLDVGDHIGAEGTLFVTRTGEKSIKVSRWTMLSKALLPLPEKWHGLKDTEARYRQRYLDMISNPEVRDVFRKRSAMIREVREFLNARSFLEVETPMMQAQAGGAAARPFITHYTALDSDMFLRIAPELYLKRLLVGGFDKVFELNRNFRNEGLSRTHNPEFTMLEVYEAYGNVSSMKRLVQDLIVHLAQAVFGGLIVGKEGSKMDLTPPWREVNYRDLVKEVMGPDWYDMTPGVARQRAEAKGLSVDPSWDLLMISHEVYEKLIEKTLLAPTFVMRLPADLVPLARACDDDPASVDVFELVIGGKEIAPAYSEMNDALEQRRRLEQQASREKSRIDEDFLTALEHGMPPAGGMGIGIDRLFMILSGEESIRDVILFPHLRPMKEHHEI
jgi:lysyl-tRNA synthetase, class II